jgi:hypothetical protein
MDEVKLMEIADRMDVSDRTMLANAICEAFDTWKSTGVFSLPGFTITACPEVAYNDLISRVNEMKCESQYEKSNNEISYKTDNDFKVVCIAWFMIGVMLGVSLIFGLLLFQMGLGITGC